MLAPTPKTQRFLEAIQITLTFASVCAIVDATASVSTRERAAGFYASAPHESERSMDRRITDLARADRKRREAEQLANRRKLASAVVSVPAASSLDGAAAPQPFGECPAEQSPCGTRGPAGQHVGWPMHTEIHATRADEHREKRGEPDQVSAHG